MKPLTLLLLLVLTVTTTLSEDPKELAKLKETYKREMERVTTPVDSKYVEALEQLQKKLAASNKLDEALKVRSAIENVQSGDSRPSSGKSAEPESVSLRKWSGDGNLTREDGKDVLRVETDRVESKKVEQTFSVDDFPDGMRLHVYYRTSDYAGTGLKLKAYYNARDFLYRIVPMIADGEWHEYVWNYETEHYRGASTIRMQLELLGGQGEVEFKGLKVTSL